MKLYLDIESILDVRYGALVNHDSSLADELVFKLPQYVNRTHDNFELIFPSKISRQQRIDILKPYNKDNLKASPRTSIFNIVDMIVRSLVGMEKTTDDFSLIFNTLDYDLTDDEKEMFQLLISARFEHKYPVEVISRSLRDVTPAWLERNVAAGVIYRINEWWMLFAAGLMNKPMPHVAIYSPTLFVDKLESNKGFIATHKALKSESDPMTLVKEIIALYVAIHPVDNRFFSPLTIK